MTQILKQKEFIVSKSQLLSFFDSGCKSESEFKIGVELEKLSVNSVNYEAVKYSEKKGIGEFLTELKNAGNWEYILENNTILGLKKNEETITLEPGSQMEYSSEPLTSLKDIENQIKDFNKETGTLAEKFGMNFLGYGIQPVSTFENIELMPKKRYGLMTEYLPAKASLPFVMMRETAGIQVSLDYQSEEDAMKKLKVALAISPIMTAIFANSPIRNGKNSGYKSFRAYGWLNTDNERCGLISKKIFEEDFSFSDYVDVLLDLPMIFLQKEDKWFNMQGLTFKEYLNKGFEGYKAEIEDWYLHMSSFFPDVRMKNCLELRNCDCQRTNLMTAIPALWKSILYNQSALDDAWSLVKDISWIERLELREQVAKYALDSTVNNIKVKDIAKELFSIAYNSLKQDKEEIYLDNLKAYTLNGISPADEIIDLWENNWNKDIKKLIEFVKVSPEE